MAIDRQGLIDEARQDPKFAPAIAQMEQRIANMPVTSDDLEDGIKLLEQMLEDSSNYNQIKASAIEEGLLAEGILPDQFDPIAIVALLVALYGLQEKVAQKGYARGGLKVAAKKLQRAGRGGDSMLAHINPREAEILRGMGASGRRNPATGLPEFKSDLGKILGAIAPIAINTFFPQISNVVSNWSKGVVGPALSSVIGNTVIGAATTALTGGKVLKGALAGANLGGLNEYIGGNLLGIQNPLMASLTGGALTGGAAGLFSGNGMRGAVRGALGAGASALAKQSGNTAIQQAGKGFGSMIGAGFDPRMAMYAGAAGGLSGIAQNLMRGSPAAQLATKPSEEVLRNPVTPQAAAPGAYIDPGSAGANAAAAAGATPPAPPAPPPPPPATGLTADDMLKYGMLGLAAMPLLNYMSGDDSSGQNAPKDAQTVLDNTLTEDQKRQMNMPLQNWDWTKINRDAAAAGLDANSYMAQHWDKFSSGYYNKPVAKARGGALSQVAYLAKGSGSGRADTINARLSDGEYVIDAETVALLGDGSVEHGAQRLDKMRAEIRRQKGRALAKGKISPNAKSPLAYLRGM